MVANSLPEIYTLVYGWFIFDRVWSVIVTSGLVWVPFIIAIIRVTAEARSSGAHVGNAGLVALQRLENQVVAMLFVIFFACVPFKYSGFNLSVSTVNYQNNINECRPNTGARIPEQVQDAFAEIEGQMVFMPVLWGAIHSLSSAVVNAATVALPCKDDISFRMFQLSESQIQNSELRDDILKFHDVCFTEAKYNLSESGYTPDPNDTDWLGSSYFMNTAGYYKDLRFGPLEGWTHDERFTNHSDPELVYRSCRDYWLDNGQGLERRIIDEVDPELANTFINTLYEWLGASSSIAERRRAFVHSILAVSIVDDLGAAFYEKPSVNSTVFTKNDDDVFSVPFKDLGNGLAKLFGSGGRAVALSGKNISSHSEKFIYRESSSYVLAIAQMVLIITIPLILLLSCFSLKTLAMCGVGYFALKFINFIWAFGYWLETTWMTALRSDAGFDANSQMLLNVISNTAYIVLPLAWLIILGWSGFQISGALGNLDKNSQGTAQTVGNTAGNLTNPVNYATGVKGAATKAIAQEKK